MNTLFNRKIQIIWGPTMEIITGYPFVTSESIQGLNIIDVVDFVWTDYFNQQFNNKSVTNLKIEFNIKKNFSKEEDEAEIKIYNLRQDKYLITEDEDNTLYKVYLFAGYGETSEKLFGGDIESSSYTREGPNWVFTINGKDGQSVIEQTVLNKSYIGTMNLKDAMLDMIKDVGEKAKDSVKTFFTDKVKKWINSNVSNNIKISGGLSVTGKLVDQFDNFMKEIGAKLSVQDEKIEVIWENSNSKNDIILLTPNTGLIGSPIRKKDNYIEFKSLLIPKILPGGLVKIESRQINDYFRIEKVNYVGDTHGRSWECRCEGIKPNNIDDSPPIVQYYEIQNNISIEEESLVIGNA